MGLFDSFNKKKKREEDIRANNKKMAQIQQEIANSKQKVKDMSSEQEKILIQTYGSLDKVPPGMKQTFGIK
jgi:cell division protein FtsB